MRNWILAVFCMAFAIVCFVSTLSFPDQEAVYRDPAVYPQAIIGIIIVLSIVVGISGSMRRAGPGETAAPKKSMRLPIVLIVAIGTYYLMMPIVGFVVATFAFMVGIFLLFGGKIRPGSAFAAAMTAGQYVLFAILLDVRVPDPFIAYVTRSLAN